MDKEQAVKKAHAYAEIVKQHFPVKFVILFGSYIKGNARKDSDIDIAVVVEQINGDFLLLSAELYRLCEKVDIMIEPILIEYGKDPSGFLEQIIEEGLIVYSSGGN